MELVLSDSGRVCMHLGTLVCDTHCPLATSLSYFYTAIYSFLSRTIYFPYVGDEGKSWKGPRRQPALNLLWTMIVSDCSSQLFMQNFSKHITMDGQHPTLHLLSFCASSWLTDKLETFAAILLSIRQSYTQEIFLQTNLNYESYFGDISKNFLARLLCLF